LASCASSWVCRSIRMTGELRVARPQPRFGLEGGLPKWRVSWRTTVSGSSVAPGRSLMRSRHASVRGPGSSGNAPGRASRFPPLANHRALPYSIDPKGGALNHGRRGLPARDSKRAQCRRRDCCPSGDQHHTPATGDAGSVEVHGCVLHCRRGSPVPDPSVARRRHSSRHFRKPFTLRIHPVRLEPPCRLRSDRPTAALLPATQDLGRIDRRRT
jgi:hypothetical protein